MRACVLASLAVASQAFVAPTSHVPRSSNGVVALRAVGRRPEASVLATESETAMVISETQYMGRRMTAHTSAQIPTAAKVMAEDLVALSSQGESNADWSVHEVIRVPWTTRSDHESEIDSATVATTAETVEMTSLKPSSQTGQSGTTPAEESSSVTWSLPDVIREPFREVKRRIGSITTTRNTASVDESASAARAPAAFSPVLAPPAAADISAEEIEKARKKLKDDLAAAETAGAAALAEAVESQQEMGAITVAYADKLKGLAFKATTTLTRAVDSPVAEAPVSIEANDLAKFREEKLASLREMILAK